ncbi:MAG TPA: LacI family DNA-binding transcriptional regulator [Spirochaetia bacterium]|nr:LacI family DNA-binding transcriptional regulator [Spirochaetia bacterium]
MKITLGEVARKSGVSIATASQVFNNSGRISDETRARVMRSADVLGYVHRRRHGIPGRSKGVASLLLQMDPEWAFAFPFIRPIITSIAKELDAEGIDLVTIPMSHSDPVSRIIARLESVESRAVFTIHFAARKLITQLETMGIPVIVIMNGNFQDEFHTVCVDDFQGAYEGTRYLIQLGHSRIGFVDQKREDLPILSTDRFIGFTKALNEAGIDFSESLRIRYEHEKFDELQSHLTRMMRTQNAPTAFFCLDDDLAWRVFLSAEKAGLRVPGDISLLAPGDVLDYSSPLVPQITTMRIDTEYMGKIAVHMMLNRSQGKPDTNHVVKVKQHLTVRATTASPSPHS